jgi:hypothetical protein
MLKKINEVIDNLLAPHDEIESIKREMEQDISADIYGDITGHERWAEEIFRLRAELRRAREKSIEDSWARNPDRSGGQFSQDEIDRSRNGGW